MSQCVVLCKIFSSLWRHGSRLGRWVRVCGEIAGENVIWDIAVMSDGSCRFGEINPKEVHNVVTGRRKKSKYVETWPPEEFQAWRVLTIPDGKRSASLPTIKTSNGISWMTYGRVYEFVRLVVYRTLYFLWIVFLKRSLRPFPTPSISSNFQSLRGVFPFLWFLILGFVLWNV